MVEYRMYDVALRWASLRATGATDEVAILRNRLSPAFCPSRLRMCVAGCEYAWDSRLVMSSVLSRRFLHPRSAVLGPSTSRPWRTRFNKPAAMPPRQEPEEPAKLNGCSWAPGGSNLKTRSPRRATRRWAKDAVGLRLHRAVSSTAEALQAPPSVREMHTPAPRSAWMASSRTAGDRGTAESSAGVGWPGAGVSRWWTLTVEWTAPQAWRKSKGSAGEWASWICIRSEPGQGPGAPIKRSLAVLSQLVGLFAWPWRAWERERARTRKIGGPQSLSWHDQSGPATATGQKTLHAVDEAIPELARAGDSDGSQARALPSVCCAGATMWREVEECNGEVPLGAKVAAARRCLLGGEMASQEDQERSGWMSGKGRGIKMWGRIWVMSAGVQQDSSEQMEAQGRFLLARLERRDERRDADMMNKGPSRSRRRWLLGPGRWSRCHEKIQTGNAGGSDLIVGK
jgi:hypothetical protein